MRYLLFLCIILNLSIAADEPQSANNSLLVIWTIIPISLCAFFTFILYHAIGNIRTKKSKRRRVNLNQLKKP